MGAHVCERAYVVVCVNVTIRNEYGKMCKAHV